MHVPKPIISPIIAKIITFIPFFLFFSEFIINIAIINNEALKNDRIMPKFTKKFPKIKYLIPF